MYARSYLYVPGDQPEKLSKARQRGSDALIVDLEDAVARSAKTAARQVVAGWLQTLPHRTRPWIWVRVNSEIELLEEDLTAAIHPAIVGIYLPKVSSPDDIVRLSEMLSTRENASGVGPLAIAPLVETAAGLEAVRGIARSPRVSHLALGEADLGADLAIDPSDDEHEWQPIRSQLVVASAAAGIGPPAGSAATDFTDLDRLRRSSETYRRLGFAGRSAIHPAQIPVINQVFTPSPAVIERARRLVSLYEDATDAGRGVALDDHGRMIDEAVIRAARRTLELAEQLACLNSIGATLFLLGGGLIWNDTRKAQAPRDLVGSINQQLGEPFEIGKPFTGTAQAHDGDRVPLVVE